MTTTPKTQKAPKAPTITEPDGAAIPAPIKLTCPFAFYDENNELKSWQAGQEITDPAEIKTLLDAGAEHEDME